MPFPLCTVQAGILEETKYNNKNTILMSAVPKSDPLYQRMIPQNLLNSLILVI